MYIVPCFDFNFSNCDPVILVFRFLGLICFGSPNNTYNKGIYLPILIYYTEMESWRKFYNSVPSHIIQRRWLFCACTISKSFSESSRNWSKKLYEYKMKCWPDYLGQIQNKDIGTIFFTFQIKTYVRTPMDISCLPRAYLPSSRGLTGSLSAASMLISQL